MPIIDSVEGYNAKEAEKKANERVSFWTKKVHQLGGGSLVAIGKEAVNSKNWNIVLEVTADPDSDEFKRFMARFGRE